MNTSRPSPTGIPFWRKALFATILAILSLWGDCRLRAPDCSSRSEPPPAATVFPGEAIETPSDEAAGLPPVSGDLTPVFPPNWHVGDRWRVVMSAGEPPDFWVDARTTGRIWDMHVLGVPSGDDGLYRIEATGQERLGVARLFLHYRKRPFSFAGITSDARERTEGLLERHVPRPDLGGFLGFFTYFPVAPSLRLDAGSVGGIQYYPGHPPIGQIIETEGDIVRFTLVTQRWDGMMEPVPTIIEWRRGEPWWSSIVAPGACHGSDGGDCMLGYQLR